ncbi:DUF4932 domain-containing protein [Aureibacter tunicatorum]|uniref:DUF4932 domain-containing protein n=1 Tax=Aureibacter tunicatorum TaxID=866807 RepID=UPI0030CA2101
MDKRTELLSIVFRLAEAREYSSNAFPLYVDKINAHFIPYKKHPLIRFVKSDVIGKNFVGYDAVMKMAIQITDPPGMEPIVPFTNELPDKRWGKENANKFLKLLNQFYTDAKCEEFFQSNEALYEEASRRFGLVYDELDLKWYKDFYGQQPKGEFRIVIGLGNGGGNYGPNIVMPDGKDIIYAIMGAYTTDSTGMAVFKIHQYFPTLLHEFNHSFVNHLVEKHHPELKKSGKKNFKPVKDLMISQAYGGWQTMYAESMVRASVIKYLEDHKSKKRDEELTEEISRGFIWTDKLVAKLNEYDQNRKEYPSLESFMPEIIKFFDQTAFEIYELNRQVNNKRPQILDFYPFDNNAKNVDPSIKELVLTMDKNISELNLWISRSYNDNKTYPEAENITFDSETKKLKIEFKKLEANTSYQFKLRQWAIKTEEGYGINDYTVSFDTSK